MGSALRDVWVRASCGDPVFSYDDVHRWRQDEFERLVLIGVLRETAQARYVLCDACTEGHREEVAWESSVRTPTGIRGYIPCPEERSVPIDPERLRQWAVDAGTLARLIAAVTELSGPVEEKTRGFWYLGRRRIAGRFREFCLAVRPGADALNSARTYSTPVVLAADGHGAWMESGVAAFFLPDVASLSGDRLVVDLDYIEDALPRERAIEKSQNLRSVPLPEHVAWNDLVIEVGDTSVAVAAGGTRRELSFEESGFADMRQGDMAGDRALQTLRLFASRRGRFSPRKTAATGEEKTPFKKQVSVLRQRLKGLLPVEGEPIVFEKTSGEYRCAFAVFLESDSGFPTPAAATWQDFRFEKATDGRLRVGVKTREIFQARTPSRGTDAPSSEAAERETRLWRDYPLDRLGLATSQGLPNQEGLALLAFVRGAGRLKRRADDMAVLRLGRRLREWTSLASEPFRYDESKAVWIACFECGDNHRCC
jgi:hypothetical protein